MHKENFPENENKDLKPKIAVKKIIFNAHTIFFIFAWYVQTLNKNKIYRDSRARHNTMLLLLQGRYEK